MDLLRNGVILLGEKKPSEWLNNIYVIYIFIFILCIKDFYLTEKASYRQYCVCGGVWVCYEVKLHEEEAKL